VAIAVPAEAIVKVHVVEVRGVLILEKDAVIIVHDRTGQWQGRGQDRNGTTIGSMSGLGGGGRRSNQGRLAGKKGT
jgi:hypothetical protein